MVPLSVPGKMLGWRICRANFGAKYFWGATPLRISCEKGPEILPEILESLLVGILAKFPTKFPCRKSQKIHRRASAGAQGEENGSDGSGFPVPVRFLGHLALRLTWSFFCVALVFGEACETRSTCPSDVLKRRLSKV